MKYTTVANFARVRYNGDKVRRLNVEICICRIFRLDPKTLKPQGIMIGFIIKADVHVDSEFNDK